MYFTAEWFDLSAVGLGYRILFFIYEIVGNFNEIYLTELVLYIIKPYVNPNFNDYLDIPKDLGDDISSFFSMWLYRYPDIEYLNDCY